jgi:tetratricopeptide (TPR) repeat protein
VLCLKKEGIKIVKIKSGLNSLVTVFIISMILITQPQAAPCATSAQNDAKIAFGYSLLKNPNRKNIAGALKIFGEALAKDPNAVAAHMGVVYARLYQFTSSPGKNRKELGDGLSHVNAALKINPKLPDAYKKKSYLLYYMGRKKEAVAALQAGMVRIPKSGELLEAYLSLLIKLGRIQEALKTCALKKSRFKNLPELRIRLGYIWLKAGYAGQARECFSRSVSEHETPEGWTAVGDSFGAEKNWKKAIEFYKWALNADPDFYDVYYSLAACYTRMGDIKKAVSWLAPYTEAFPDDIQALRELALLYEKNGKNTRARLTWMKVKAKSKNQQEKMIAAKRIEKLRNKRKK